MDWQAVSQRRIVLRTAVSNSSDDDDNDKSLDHLLGISDSISAGPPSSADGCEDGCVVECKWSAATVLPCQKTNRVLLLAPGCCTWGVTTVPIPTCRMYTYN